MPEFHRGREELGQNFLVHPKYKSMLIRLTAAPGHPVVELAEATGPSRSHWPDVAAISPWSRWTPGGSPN